MDNPPRSIQFQVWPSAILEQMEIVRVPGPVQSPAQRRTAALATILFGVLLMGLVGWLSLIQYAYHAYGRNASGHVVSSSPGLGTAYEFTTRAGEPWQGSQTRIHVPQGSAIVIEYLPFAPYFNRLSGPASRETRRYPFILGAGVLFMLLGVGARRSGAASLK